MYVYCKKVKTHSATIRTRTHIRSEVKANISQSWWIFFHSKDKLGRTKEDGCWIKFRPLGHLAKMASWEASGPSRKTKTPIRNLAPTCCVTQAALSEFWILLANLRNQHLLTKTCHYRLELYFLLSYSGDSLFSTELCSRLKKKKLRSFYNPKVMV